MPYTNFLAAPLSAPDYDWLGNMLQNYMQGYTSAQAPYDMAQARKKQEIELQNAISQNKILGAQAEVAPQMSKEQLRNQQLQNALASLQGQYYPQQQKILMDLNKAKLNAVNNPQPQQTYIQRLIAERDQYPKNSPEWSIYNNILLKKGAQSAGTTVFDTNGNPIVQIGGANNVKPGQTYVGADGKTYTAPTVAQSTRNQKGIIGVDTLLPYAKEAYKNLSPFLSGWKDLQAKSEGFANRWLGGDFKAPSQKALGLAALNESAEGIVSMFQLNSTSQNIERAAHILAPQYGESQKGYEDRVTKQLADFVNQQKTLQKAAQGIPLGTTTPSSQNNASQDDPLGLLGGK